MYKVRITGLKQGLVEHKDGTYSVGFNTKYGIVWLAGDHLWTKFARQNRHLINELSANELSAADFVGRYLFITDKHHEEEGRIGSPYEGMTFITPIL